MATQIATFGGGCFWCIEAAFLNTKGVLKVVSGYAAGETDNPSYKDICTGTTGHAEVVQVEYDDSVVTYQDLLSVFFTVHDPTTLNRQGNDVGTQYRSIILTHDDQQKELARAFVHQLTEEKTFDAPLVTQIEDLPTFYPAEDYHQNYYALNSMQPYCQFVISPKLAKMRKQCQSLLKR